MMIWDIKWIINYKIVREFNDMIILDVLYFENNEVNERFIVVKNLDNS